MSFLTPTICSNVGDDGTDGTTELSCKVVPHPIIVEEMKAREVKEFEKTSGWHEGKTRIDRVNISKIFFSHVEQRLSRRMSELQSPATPPEGSPVSLIVNDTTLPVMPRIPTIWAQMIPWIGGWAAWVVLGWRGSDAPPLPIGQWGLD